MVFSLLLSGCDNSRENLPLSEQGDMAFARRDYKKAANIWKSAHNKAPEDTTILAKLGDCYLKLSRIERAKFFLKKAARE